VRARAGSGKRGGRDNLARRALSFIEPLAAPGCGEGINSGGPEGGCRFRAAGLRLVADEAGVDEVEEDEGDEDVEGSTVACGNSASNGSGAAAVLWKRSCGVVSRCIFFAAAYGHAGRRGNWFASNCEAHREKGIRFIKEEKEQNRGRRRGVRRRDRAQQQLDAVVCASAVKSRLPELFCQAFMPQASSSQQHSRPHVKPAAPLPHEPAHSHAIMGGGGKIPYGCPPDAPPGARLTSADTPSTSGHRPEVGTPSPPTGKATRPSWAWSLPASSEWPGRSAQTESTATRCPNRVDSSPADSTQAATHRTPSHWS
jgi:hypothetical protein